MCMVRRPGRVPALEWSVPAIRSDFAVELIYLSLCGLQAQHFAPRPRPERDAVGAGGGLQGREQVVRINDSVRIRWREKLPPEMRARGVAFGPG